MNIFHQMLLSLTMQFKRIIYPNMTTNKSTEKRKISVQANPNITN